MEITRLSLHQKMIEISGQDFSAKKIHVLNFLTQEFELNGAEIASNALNNFMRQSFFPTYITKWKAAGRKEDNFLSRYEDWLAAEVIFPDEVLRPQHGHANLRDFASRSNAGRPLKAFQESSDVIKRRSRKTEEIRQKMTAAELSFAASMKLRKEGNVAASKLVAEATMTTPTRATQILSCWRKSCDVPLSSYSSEEALSLIISKNMTVEMYKDLRRGAKKHGFDLYPPYYKLLELKRELYPRDIFVSEIKCEVPLQNLLHKTCESLIKCLVPDCEKSTFCLICKWGFDGSSGYTSYRQIRERQSTSAEESLFTTSLVPLRLIDEMSSVILWKNPRPSSKSYCRPIRLQWVHETDALSKQEQLDIERQIALLQPYISNFGPIRFELKLTMVDGKVCGALTETSSMTCYICGVKISKMNDLTPRPIRQEGLHFGLSVLHAYIRFFECLLHVAYRLEIKSWKVTKEKKPAYDARKKKIQEDFRTKMGLLVDIPKQGAGSTNNGNTARRFFSNPYLSSQITGIDETLIKKFDIILRVLNSGYLINTDRFEEYCKAAAELYVSLYYWYYMPTSVHKILIHGAVVIKECLLPIGELSEEAQESKNKDIRKYRNNHTQKISPVKINEDLFNRLLLSSDPLLSSFHNPNTLHRKLDPDMLPLLDFTENEKHELKGDESDDDENAMAVDCDN